MWLLKLHFAISILAILTFVGVKIVFEEQIKNNGYGSDSESKNKLSNYLIFFTPVLNVLFVIMLFVIIAVNKHDLDELYKDK